MIVCLLMLMGPILSTESQAKSDKEWKIGHVRSSGSAIDKDIHALVEKIARQTHGDISFDVYPGNRLGDYSVVQERVSFGEVEMYVGPVATAIDKKMMLAFTPFLVNTWTEARAVYSHGSPLLKIMEGYLEAQNIKLLGGWPVYFGGIALTQKPVSPGDPSVSKETLIRVPPIKSFELTARALGFTPYPITWMYARMGLKTGMVSGIMGGGAEGYAGLGKHVKYYLPVKDHFEYWFVYMNLDLWKSLPDTHKNALSQSVVEMENNRYDRAETHEKESLKQLKDLGVEILDLSEKERFAMETRVRKLVWPVLKQEIGPAFDTIVSPK